MGTSNGNPGQGGRTPLVPSWLTADVPPPLPGEPPQVTPPVDAPAPSVPLSPVLPAFPPLPAFAAADRFKVARNNFSRFAASGGSDRRSLGRALSRYISTAAGGSRIAAQRMGASRTAGAQLARFLSNAVANGPHEALRALHLENLAGHRIEEVFIGLVEYVCPEGGSLDEGIAREAFIETIADLADNGVVNFDTLNTDQMQTIFELYAAHAIEIRLCNDIGANAIVLPADATHAASLQRQLIDFVRRSVGDAITQARQAMLTLTPERVSGFVTRVYEEAFRLLQSFGESEADLA